LGITYPEANLDALLAAMRAALPAWRDAGPHVRADVCVEILTRLNARSHELAQAVMHTTGQGFMMAFQAGGPHAQDRGLAIVDYTGSSEFGDWLEEHARQTRVYAEKAGVNAVVVDSTDGYRAMLQNLAFTLSLYSGQMCTTTQNVFVSRGGIETDEGRKTF